MIHCANAPLGSSLTHSGLDLLRDSVWLIFVELQSVMAVIGYRPAIDKPLAGISISNYAYLCAYLIPAEDEKINTRLSTGPLRPIAVGISTVVTRPVNTRG
jgi:hypothetical protein